MADKIRERLIAGGIRNLTEYGYPYVTAQDILTDKIYSAFFSEMLRDNLGKGLDAQINALLKEIEEAQP